MDGNGGQWNDYGIKMEDSDLIYADVTSLREQTKNLLKNSQPGTSFNLGMADTITITVWRLPNYEALNLLQSAID